MKNILIKSIIRKHGVSTLETLASYCFNKSVTVSFSGGIIYLITESGCNILDDYSRRIALGKFYKMQSEHKFGFLFGK